MEGHLSVLAALAVALLWVIQFFYRIFASPLHGIPGPWYSKVTRLPLKFSIITGQRIYFVHNLHKRYGHIVRLAPDEVSISSLSGFREIHRSGSPFLKSKWYEKFALASTGVFAMSDHKQHAQRRKLFARPFSKTELRRSWEPIVKEKAKVAVSRIRQDLTASGVSDVLKWWTFFATDTSAHLMFGESFKMLQLGKKNEYIQVLESTMMGSGISAELPAVGLVGRHVPMASFRAMFRANDYLLKYGEKAVANSKRTSDSSRNIFASMIYESEKDRSALTETDVAIESGNLIVAGSDTTAITLTYLIWAVLSEPLLQQRLEYEVDQLDPDFDDDAVEELPLLNAVIMETLRLYGAAPGALPRVVPETGATFGGFYIPQGATVSTQSYTIHRCEDLFANAEQFDPSRWLPGTKNEVSSEAKMAFSPFGAGSRICLGINLAWMELRLAAAEFFRECKGARVGPATTDESMRMQNYFLVAPAGHKCEITR